MTAGISDLVHRVRPSVAEPQGALVLLHGRGADEGDLWPLLDVLDPKGHLVGVTPRGPLPLPPGGAHWYVVRAVGYPDKRTFEDTFALLSSWLDAWLESRALAADRVVVGGFSQGAVMAYALAFGPGRPRPRAVVAFSGFLPNVDGFDLDLERAARLRVAIGHGAFDPVIGVEWGREARRRLEAAGADVLYRETPMGHTIDPRFLPLVADLVVG
jgi:phospholipase/carboxylesterase